MMMMMNSMIKFNISDVAVDQVGMDVRVKFGNSILNNGRIIQLVTSHTSFTHFCAVFNCILRSSGSSY